MRRILRFILILVTMLLLITTSSHAQIHKVKISELKENVADESQEAGKSVEFEASKVNNPTFTNSPGTVVGATWYEHQHNGSMSRMIALDSLGGIHFTWMNRIGEGDNRYVDYNYLNSAGDWLGAIHVTPSDIYGGYTGIAGMLPNNREVLCFHNGSGYGNSWYSYLAVEKTIGGTGDFFLYDIPDSGQGAKRRLYWPKAVVDSLKYIHVVMKEDMPLASSIDVLGYTRCYIDDTTLVCEAPGLDAVHLNPTTKLGDPIANLVAVFDSNGAVSQTIVASPVSKKVAVIYTKYTNPNHSEVSGDVYYIESTNCGQDWIDAGSFDNISKNNITNYSVQDTIRAYWDLAALYDYNNNLHILWTTPGYWELQDSATIDACFLWHWSQSSGISLVSDGWEPSRPGKRNRTISKMSTGVNPTNNYLYTVWTKFDISDTASWRIVWNNDYQKYDTVPGYSNGEIYASASSDGGWTWDIPRNLTNTQTPGCQAGECESDHWSSLAEKVNDTLHIQYICDKDAGASNQSEGEYTDNAVLYLKIPAWIPGIFPVIANFSGSPRVGYLPLTVQFSDSSAGDPTSWYWHFSDGTTDTVNNPMHSYNDTGYFDVILVAANEADSDSVVKENYIHVLSVIAPTLSWTGEDGYQQDAVSPDTSINETIFQFKILYSDQNNIPPASGYPKINIDINGDGDFNDDNEGTFTMGPADADTIYSDGKIYYYNTTLPISATCQYSFSAQNNLSLTATGEPTSLKQGPVVLDNTVALDLYVHSSDIIFSQSNPDEGDTFTVYATIHNNSDSSVSDVLVNFYDGENLLGQKLIPYIPGRESAQTSLDISFSTMGFYPIKVVVDEDNSFTEWNEFNNWAIRPVKIGNYPVEGDIIVEALINSPVYTHSRINIPGNARYYPLEWEKVCGAKVTATILETSQEYTTYTNNLGNFNLGFWGPDNPGTYNIKVEVTDFTLTGDTTLTLQVIIQDKPDLVVDVNVTGEFKIGQNLAVTTKVSNIGGEPAYNFRTQLYKNNSPIYYEDRSSLQAGESFWLAQQTVSFEQVGSHCIKAITDIDGSVTEFNEANNQDILCFNVADTTAPTKCVDLRIDPTDLFVSKTRPSLGDTIRFIANIRNNCDSTLHNVPVRFYIDSVQYGSDYIIPEIQSGQNQQAMSTQTWTVNFSKHLIEVMTDPQNVFSETNESNNRASVPLPYDLYPYYRAKCPGSLPYFLSKCNSSVNQEVTIYGSIRNKGGFDLLGNVHIQISDNLEGTLGVITADSVLSRNQNYSIESILYSFTQIGNHTLTATVDYDNQYDEWNEGSDNIYSNAISIDSLRPDLMIHSDYINPSSVTPDSGDTVDIYATMYNIGQVIAESIWVQFLMDEMQLGDLVLIDSIPTGPENYKIIQASEPWIATCEPQNLHICRVKVDPNSQIIELNETNNEATRSIIACGAPDLFVDTILFLGCKREFGDPVTISAVIKNSGTDTADAQVCFYYYDASLVLRQIQYTYVTVPALGGTDTAQTLWYSTLDSTQVCARIENSNPPEYDTTNNFYCTLFRSFMRGDANADGKLSISDVVYIINYLFKGGPVPVPTIEVADINFDGKVSVSDVIYLINYLFRGGPLPC
jgi:subtilase family serine protease